MRALRLLAPALLAAAGCGDPLFFAQVKEEKICLALQDRSVPAAPEVAAALGPQTVTWAGDLDLGSKVPGLDKRNAVKGSIRMVSLDVLATTDLSGVRDATVTILDGAGNPTTFMHYEPPGTAPGDLAMKLDQDLNLLDHLDGGVLHYKIDFSGTPPTSDWRADVQSCLSLDITIDALEAMK
jgi:hypothetical protein